MSFSTLSKYRVLPEEKGACLTYLSHEATLQLIAAVKKQKQIWNESHTFYFNNDIKLFVWDSIITELYDAGCKDADCAFATWQNLAKFYSSDSEIILSLTDNDFDYCKELSKFLENQRYSQVSMTDEEFYSLPIIQKHFYKQPNQSVLNQAQQAVSVHQHVPLAPGRTWNPVPGYSRYPPHGSGMQRPVSKYLTSNMNYEKLANPYHMRQNTGRPVYPQQFGYSAMRQPTAPVVPVAPEHVQMGSSHPTPPTQNRISTGRILMAPARNRVASAQNRISPGRILMAPAQNRVASAQNRILPGQILMAPAQNRVASAQNRISPGRILMAPAQNRVASAQNRISPCRILMAPAQNRVASAQNRILPGQILMAPAQNRVASAQNRILPGQILMAPAQNRIASVQNRMETAQIRIAPSQNRVAPAYKAPVDVTQTHSQIVKEQIDLLGQKIDQSSSMLTATSSVSMPLRDSLMMSACPSLYDSSMAVDPPCGDIFQPAEASKQMSNMAEIVQKMNEKKCDEVTKKSEQSSAMTEQTKIRQRSFDHIFKRRNSNVKAQRVAAEVQPDKALVEIDHTEIITEQQMNCDNENYVSNVLEPITELSLLESKLEEQASNVENKELESDNESDPIQTINEIESNNTVIASNEEPTATQPLATVTATATEPLAVVVPKQPTVAKRNEEIQEKDKPIVRSKFAPGTELSTTDHVLTHIILMIIIVFFYIYFTA